MPKNFRTHWSTEEEVAFIKSLSRAGLIGYRRGLALRWNWKGLDKDRIIDLLNELDLDGKKH